MFQNFRYSSDQAIVKSRLEALRRQLHDLQIDAFLVPRADEYQGEYVPARSERLAWISGFTGSAGMALIGLDRAILFVDGRYTLQAADQVDATCFEIEDLVNNPPAKWLKSDWTAGKNIGFDPWLTTVSQARQLRRAVEQAGGELVALDTNPVDEIWEDQPPPPQSEITLHDTGFAGVSAADKLALVSGKIRDAGADWFVSTDPASQAWLLNIRGNDIPHIPLALCFAFIPASGRCKLFVSQSRLADNTRAYLKNVVEFCPPEELEDALARIAAGSTSIGLDPEITADRVREIVEASDGTVTEFSDPCSLPRATKNPTEIAGARAAHLRDGVAVSRFLAWIDRTSPGELDEIGAATKLEALRRETGERFQKPLREIAFDTISGSGPNGAIVHYRVTERTNSVFRADSLYLVDSGAQYDDGTTDITRTVSIGSPADEMKKHYTLVLKGLIAISQLRFPARTRGSDIDAIARVALWRHGLDYAHGTGHGVGSYLSVHEGPQRIARTGTQELLPGMILSNEPGFYRNGKYGIRLENLIVVTKAEPIDGGSVPMHGFETLTHVPFDTRLISPDLLTPDEEAWLDAYHRRTRDLLSPHLDSDDLAWLEQATRAMKQA